MSFKKTKAGFIKTKGVAGWTMIPLAKFESYKINIEPFAEDKDIVNVGDWSGTKDQIQQTKIDYFKPDEPETNHDEKNKIARELDINYFNFRKHINSMTPEKKAERLEMFNLLYWGMTGKHDIPVDIAEQVIEIQTKFFKENTKRIYCSPFLFKKLFTDFQIFNPAFVMIERSILVDIKSSKKFSTV